MGDIIKIKNGMHLPVDGLVVEGTGIVADESAMTGESDHRSKACYETCARALSGA